MKITIDGTQCCKMRHSAVLQHDAADDVMDYKQICVAVSNSNRQTALHRTSITTKTVLTVIMREQRTIFASIDDWRQSEANIDQNC